MGDQISFTIPPAPEMEDVADDRMAPISSTYVRVEDEKRDTGSTTMMMMMMMMIMTRSSKHLQNVGLRP
jgi:hypothetical protein